MKRINRSASFLTALATAAILSGCGSTGVGDIFGGGTTSNPRDDDRYQQSISDVRGTVERVDTVNQRIIVDSEEVNSRNNLRNGGDELVLYYDSRTTVEHDGRTYRPEDLEEGDRILADVDQSGDRLMVEQIEVLYDATSGSQTSSRDQDDDWSYDTDNDDIRATELRGTVRSINTRDRTLELESTRYGSNFNSGSTSGSGSSVVTVHYDSNTVVEFEGRRYQPENLERGDRVEIEIRNSSGRMIAEEILVVGEGALTR
jgi:hypothetical protein